MNSIVHYLSQLFIAMLGGNGGGIPGWSLCPFSQSLYYQLLILPVV